MKLHLIFSSSSQYKDRVDAIVSAANKRDLELKKYKEDFTFNPEIRLSGEDAVFRATPGNLPIQIENFLINKNVRTIYKSWFLGVHRKGRSFFANRSEDLPIIPFLPIGMRVENHHMNFIEEAGNPFILKVLGFSEGNGVFRVNSIKELKELVEQHPLHEKILRPFIQHKKTIRVCVVGDRVVTSYINKNKNDFRTNSSGTVADFSTEVDPKYENIGLRAVHSMGYEFGGVDILISESGDYLISEVNTPFDFGYIWKETGYNIGNDIIDYLKRK